MRRAPSGRDPARAPRKIFRREAIEHYASRGHEQVLPAVVRPRVFVLLWALLGLLGTGLGLASGIEIPTFTPAVGVVNPELGRLVVFVPPDAGRGLAPGAPVVSADARGDDRWSSSVTERVPEVLSPETAVQRFGLSGAAACAVSGPVVAVLASLEDVPEDLRQAGTVLSVRVETGRERPLSRIADLGGWTGG
jgi:hypothetical protein